MPNPCPQPRIEQAELILSLHIGSEVQVVFKYHQTQEGMLVGGPIHDPSGSIATPKKRSPRGNLAKPFKFHNEKLDK